MVRINDLVTIIGCDEHHGKVGRVLGTPEGGGFTYTVCLKKDIRGHVCYDNCFTKDVRKIE